MMLDMEHKIYLSRGKRLDNKQWVYGAVLFHDGNAATIFNQHPGDGSLQGFEVDIETVCRCTGITDMNNNLIWENDIIKDRDRRGRKSLRYKVVWDYEEGMWAAQSCTNAMMYGIGDVNCNDYEKIGNIFDQKSLKIRGLRIRVRSKRNLETDCYVGLFCCFCVNSDEFPRL